MSLTVIRAGAPIAETPVGAIQGYAGSSAPAGWLLCDGTAVSRTSYAELFGVIGTTYGSGDGSTTFNLPNTTGYIIYATRLATRVTVNQPPEYVTALPSSPTDGQEVYYAADATNGVIWHLRYRGSSSSSYKWEFIGGPSLVAYSQGQVPGSGGVSMTANAWTPISTAATLNVPLPGTYNVELEGTIYSNATSEVGMGIGNNSTSSVADNMSAYYANTNTWLNLQHRSQVTVTNSSHTQTLLFISLNSQTNAFRKNAVISYTPVRVS